jgi:two-component system chemotaxis response regulator CheB
MPDPLDVATAKAQHDMHAQAHGDRRGALTMLTCPECGGTLWQVNEKELLRFRCHVGHVYLGETLLAEKSALLEAALWTAVRSFKEKSILAVQLASRARETNDPKSAARWEDEGRLADHYALVIQQHLLNVPDPPPGVTTERPAVVAPAEGGPAKGAPES